MRPRNVIVTFECRNTIPAKDIVAGLEERLAGLGLVERPRANVVRRAKCMDLAADGPKLQKPASKSVAANRRRK